MAELFPTSAQALLDAVCATTEPHCSTKHLVAAALRAAADQVSYCLDGSAYFVVAKEDLLAIAAELEGQ